MASVTFDLVTHNDAQPACPAVQLEDRTTLTYSELAELVGEFERAPRDDGKALVLCAGDRDLPTLLAYLAALRLGHAVAFLSASNEILSVYQPEFVVPAPGSGSGLADLGTVRPQDWLSARRSSDEKTVGHPVKFTLTWHCCWPRRARPAAPFVDQVPRSAAGKIQRWRLAPHHENGTTPP